MLDNRLTSPPISYKDRERAVYGLKEKNLAKAYIKVIPLNRHDPDAIRLQNWKRPTERGVCYLSPNSAMTSD